jgi:hypothetical protein
VSGSSFMVPPGGPHRRGLRGEVVLSQRAGNRVKPMAFGLVLTQSACHPYVSLGTADFD